MLIEQGYEGNPLDTEDISAQEDLSRDIWFDLRTDTDTSPEAVNGPNKEDISKIPIGDDSTRSSRERIEDVRSPLVAPKPFQTIFKIGLDAKSWSEPMPEPAWISKPFEPMFVPLEQIWTGKLR